ncbi:hypothetical protein V1L54_02280 [Streptomyces sp. TRM 70361]|uniref:hypothetical protein n=1 Tax=Streptomyces sp. TRM 70361 TaxID=3116553 RepID=UPI002E7BF69E|nr:hypothetical protein [Streptomyces sp. TRM 70361]MEE1938255.1 hypothetical protein [Streptomyces sp. TRM 70361]
MLTTRRTAALSCWRTPLLDAGRRHGSLDPGDCDRTALDRGRRGCSRTPRARPS